MEKNDSIFTEAQYWLCTVLFSRDRYCGITPCGNVALGHCPATICLSYWRLRPNVSITCTFLQNILHLGTFLHDLCISAILFCTYTFKLANPRLPSILSTYVSSILSFSFINVLFNSQYRLLLATFLKDCPFNWWAWCISAKLPAVVNLSGAAILIV